MEIGWQNLHRVEEDSAVKHLSGNGGCGGMVSMLLLAVIVSAVWWVVSPANSEPVTPPKKFSVHYYNGWWAHIEGNAYPFGPWRMDRGPYLFKWMAQLEFPIERLTKDGPRR